MGVITVKIEDTIERKLRAYAIKKYGSKKGALGLVISEALEAQITAGDARDALRELLDKEHHLGGGISKISREELHARN